MYSPSCGDENERPAATLRGGALLPKGFYDLQAVIPMPSLSRPVGNCRGCC